MRALILLFCGVAWADASIPSRETPATSCQAQIDVAARKMTGRGYKIFGHPIVSTSFKRIHVTFSGGDDSTIAYIAIFDRTDKPTGAWRHFPDDPWSRWEKQLEGSAAEIGYLKGSRDGLRHFAAAFQPAAEACLEDVRHGSSLRNQAK